MGSSKKKSARTRHILDNKRCVFISRISYAIWREDLGLAQLFQRKGKTWHNMGLQVKAEFFCNLIEAAFMSERCNLIVSRGGELLSVKDHFSLMMLREITWQSYFSYVYLKRAGYSLHGNPASWLKENFDELSRPGCAEAEKTAMLSEDALLQSNLGLVKDCTASPAKRRKTGAGQVIGVSVEAGQKITAGDSLVFLSTMKMETTVSCAVNGVVAHVAAAAKDNVAIGDLLVAISPV